MLDLNVGTRRQQRSIDQACLILLSTDASIPCDIVAVGRYRKVTGRRTGHGRDDHCFGCTHGHTPALRNASGAANRPGR